MKKMSYGEFRDAMFKFNEEHPDGGKAENKVMVEYFSEVCYMYDFLEKHPEYKMVDYKFTFAYGYVLHYMEKQSY